MKRQRGFTLITLTFLLALAVLGAWIGFKIFPAYLDYYTVRQVLRNALQEDKQLTNESLRRTVEKRLDVNFIRDITARDMEIERDNDTLILSVPINRKEHLAGGISISVDLEAQASAPIRQ